MLATCSTAESKYCCGDSNMELATLPNPVMQIRLPIPQAACHKSQMRRPNDRDPKAILASVTITCCLYSAFRGVINTDVLYRARDNLHNSGRWMLFRQRVQTLF